MKLNKKYIKIIWTQASNSNFKSKAENGHVDINLPAKIHYNEFHQFDIDAGFTGTCSDTPVMLIERLKSVLVQREQI